MVPQDSHSPCVQKESRVFQSLLLMQTQHLRLFLNFCQGPRVVYMSCFSFGPWDGGGPTSPNVKTKSQFAKPQHNFKLRLAMGILNNYAFWPRFSRKESPTNPSPSCIPRCFMHSSLLSMESREFRNSRSAKWSERSSAADRIDVSEAMDTRCL